MFYKLNHTLQVIRNLKELSSMMIKLIIVSLVYYLLIFPKFSKSVGLDSETTLSSNSTKVGVTPTIKTREESPLTKVTISMKATSESPKIPSTASTEKPSILKEIKMAENVTTTDKPTSLNKSKQEDVRTTEKVKVIEQEKSLEPSSGTTTVKSETKGVKQPPELLPTTVPTTITQSTESSTVSQRNWTFWTDYTTTTSVPDLDCSCDLKKGACDVNCCCDPDCSSFDRAVFSSCYIQANYSIDSKYCYTSQFIYKNNTQFKIQKEVNSGLFCILADNNPVTSLYENVQILKDANQMNKLMRLTNRYSWPDAKLLSSEKFVPGESYKHGSYLWAIENGSLIYPWSLPKSTVSRFCKNRKKLVYLEDWSSSCKHSITTEKECISKLYNLQVPLSNLKIIKSPLLINASDFQGCNDTLCTSMKLLLCKSDENCRNITGMIDSYYNHSDNVCYNVLHSLSFEILHNGTAGIKEITALIKLQNVTLASSDPVSFSQTYKIVFKWYNQTNQTLERSGFPGYLFRKPLISGSKIVVNSTNEMNRTTIQFHPESKQWIGLITSDDKLKCHPDKRMNILFGTNTQTSCQFIFPEDYLSTTDACSNLNIRIMETLLGTNTSDNSVNLFISSLGDPRADELNDWVPITLQEQQRQDCDYVITGIKLNIFYAFVGPVLNPQAKIIQVSLSFQRQSLNSQNQNLFCHFKVCSLTLTSSVLFTDTTKSSFMKFASIPVYEIKLPQDFFYPFLSSGCNTFFNSYIEILLTLVFVYNTVG